MIERRIIKWTTWILMCLTVCTVAFLLYYPVIQKRNMWEEVSEYESSTEATNSLGITKDPNEVMINQADLGDQLKMELPEDVAENVISIENDYLTRTVYVRFPTACSDYFKTYRLQGKCECVSSISYYNNNGLGVMAISLSQLYELEESYEDSSLYLSFIDPHDIYDKVVVVDAGHGEGSEGGSTMGGILERDINLSIVKYIKELFDESDQNIGVYFTRLDDSDPSLQNRVDMANAANADLFISIHQNATPTQRWTATNGTMVLYRESDESEHNSARFAQICLENVMMSLGSNSKGLEGGDRFYIIRNSNAPVALVEVGFMTNRTELDKLSTEEYQRQAAQGIYNAVIQAFEEGF